MNKSELRYKLVVRYLDCLECGDHDQAKRIKEILRRWFRYAVVTLSLLLVLPSCHMTTERLIETALWNVSTIQYYLRDTERVPRYLWATCPNQSCVHSSTDLKTAETECAKHQFCKVTKH